MSTHLQVNVENLGKLSRAEVRLGNFTVLAGKNGTGKSFVSKTLYSIFSVAGTNPLAVLFRPHWQRLSSIARHASDPGLRDDIEKHVRAFPRKIMSIPFGDEMNEVEAIQEAIPIIAEFVHEIRKIFSTAPEFVEFSEPLHKERFLKSLDTLFLLSRKDPYELAGEALESQIKDNLHGNFQTNKLSNLCSDGASATNFEIEGVVSLKVNHKVNLHLPMKESLQVLTGFSKVVFLESPELWKLEQPLKDYKFSVTGSSNVPKFFYDLSGMLERTFHGDPICPHVLERLTSSNVMDGKIVKSERGMLFQENNGGSRALPMTAMGIANIGMLALLIEHRILDENACLFIDESEAHLHPAWQVEMVKSLLSLAQAGVNVVIATHSPDIVKYLELHLKKNPEGEKLISLNHFLDGGVKHYENNVKAGVTDVLEDLGDSYYQMYLEEIGI